MKRPPKLDGLRTALRASGLRATPSRLAVLGAMREAREPLSHNQVTERVASATWDATTIYRNLVDLVEVGLLRRTDVGDHVWRFEAVGEGHGASSHPHFVCTSCGTIECLRLAKLVLASRTPRAVREREVEVQVRGVCDGCR